jgi:hypothetical protein
VSAWLLIGMVGLVGCASQPEIGTTPVAARRPAAHPSQVSLPEACALVDNADVSLMVGMDDWRSSGATGTDHSVCAYQGRGGVTVTAVVSLLRGDGRPPPAVCAPPGTTAEPRGAVTGEVCRYRGPVPDSTTVVVAGHGLAVGVRVVSRDSARGAAALAGHALTHL